MPDSSQRDQNFCYRETNPRACLSYDQLYRIASMPEVISETSRVSASLLDIWAIQFLYSCLEGRQIRLNGIPYGLDVHFRVVVDQKISHGGCGFPCESRMLFANIVGNALRGLAYYLKIANNGVLRLSVIGKFFV